MVGNMQMRKQGFAIVKRSYLALTSHVLSTPRRSNLEHTNQLYSLTFVQIASTMRVFLVT